MNDKKKRQNKDSQAVREATTPATKASPDRLTEEIRERAHELSIQRGDAPGDPVDDWLRAEKEVEAKYGSRGAKE